MLMLQYQLDQLDVFFSSMLGKKCTGRHPWCMIFIGCKINICVFSLHKRGRVISLGSENEICFIILCYHQIWGPPHLITFTFHDGLHNRKGWCLVKIIHSCSNFFFTFLCSSVVKSIRQLNSRSRVCQGHLFAICN